MTAEPKFKVHIKQGAFELRQYQEFTLIEAPDQNLDSYRGFRLVFDFIQGENSLQQKIAMTVPVVNQMSQGHIKSTAFVMPPDMDPKQVPEPLHPDLKKVFVPEREVAVVRFTFNPSLRKIEELENQLRAWIGSLGYQSVGSLQLARYNPPFIPGFLKRNELWLEVKRD